MNNRQYKIFRKATEYNLEKQKKKDNYDFLNKTACKTGQVVFAGDSITELINMELFDDYREKSGLIVYNRGISGDTSDRMAERFYDNVLSIAPSKIVMLIGINDLSKKADVSLIVNNVEKMLKQNAEVCGAKVILQAVYPISVVMRPHVRKSCSTKRIALTNDGLKQLATKYNATFIDLTEQLAHQDGNLKREYTYDGLHPNAVGFKLVIDRILEIL